MPVLVIYENDTENEPLVVYSGVTWVFQAKTKKLTVWLKDVQFDYPCERLDNKIGEKIFIAYCEIVPPEENPEEVIKMRDFTSEEKELIISTPITMDCFKMGDFEDVVVPYPNFLENDDEFGVPLSSRWDFIIDICEKLRWKYNETKDKRYFTELVRLLPNSYKVVKLC